MGKLIMVFATIWVATTGMAADTAWTGSTGNDWLATGNWSNGVPGTADTAYINTGMSAITAPAGTINVLDLGSNLGNSTLNISSDFTVNDDVFMGTGSTASDTATINQTAGTVVLGSAGTARFGNTGTGANVYNLSGGSLSTASSWDRFGAASSFTFNQTGGTFTDTGSGLILADTGGSATVNIGSGAIFNANASTATRIGHQGTATMTIEGTGEFHSTSTDVGIGYYGAGNGTVNLKDSALFDVQNILYVGRSGVGTIEQTGGTLTSGSTLMVGRYTSGDGTINLSAGAINAGADLIVGHDGTGVIEQSGGDLTVTTVVRLGNLDTGDGTVNLSGGSFTVNGSALYVGYGAGGGAGVFNQMGGAVDVTQLRLAEGTDTTGLYSISGGSLLIDTYIKGGSSGAGTFEVSGSGATRIEMASATFYKDTFRVKLDADGATLVEAIGGATSGINLQLGFFEVDTLVDFDGVVGETYDIMWTAGGFNTTDMTFTDLSGDAEFDWGIVSGQNDGVDGEYLQLTVIPEPATLGLVASLGAAMFLIRRKFMI